MLLTWQRDVYDEDNEREVSILGGGLVVPDCCEHVRKHLTVVLSYRYNDITDTQAYTDPPPVPEGATWKEGIKHAVSNVGEPIEGKTRFDVAVPLWTVGCAVDFHVIHKVSPNNHMAYPPVICCPHCGTKLPEIERTPADDLPGPVYYPVNDGDHCGTCDERNQSCRCLYPTALWRTLPPVKSHG